VVADGLNPQPFTRLCGDVRRAIQGLRCLLSLSSVAGSGSAAAKTADGHHEGWPAGLDSSFTRLRGRTPVQGSVRAGLASGAMEGKKILFMFRWRPSTISDNDPGPQTLSHYAEPPEHNIDAAYWRLSRFQGMRGLCQFHGWARFHGRPTAVCSSIIRRGRSKRGLFSLMTARGRNRLRSPWPHLFSL